MLEYPIFRVNKYVNVLLSVEIDVSWERLAWSSLWQSQQILNQSARLLVLICLLLFYHLALAHNSSEKNDVLWAQDNNSLD